MDGPKKSDLDGDLDLALSANFVHRMGTRSVRVLRQEMADRGFSIGSGAIQAMKAGSRGVRLETLQKFADFFDCKVIDLLASPDDVTVQWPFQRLSPAAYESISKDVKEAAEDMLISSARRVSPTGKR